MTTALLCFFSPDTCVQILAAVLPHGLLNYAQEGEELKIEGPIYTSFRQYVKAIATEEDTDPLRQALLKAVETQQSHVSGASLSEIISCDLLQAVDVQYSIGVLRWVITPLHRRRHECYPTRSFKVWALAVVLSELGFQVSASPWAVNTEEDCLRVSDSRYRTGHPDVILITTSVGDTDLMAPSPISIDPAFVLKPQLIPIRSIPWVAFRHLGDNDGRVNTQYLSDIWEYTFEQVTRATGFPELRMRIHVKPVPDHDLIYAEHKKLAAFWSFHIEVVLRSAMQQFVPHDEGVSDLVAPCRRHFWHRAGLEHVSELGSETLDHWYVMTAIILATIYAISCKSLRQDGKQAGAHTQVAFQPNIIYGPKVYEWANVIGMSLHGGASSAEWIGLLLEVVAGVEHPKPLTDMSSNVLSRSWQIIPAGNTSLETTTVTDVFGGQANGVSAISEFLLKPTVQPNSLIMYHVQYGQILDFPTDDRGYIRSALVPRPVYPLRPEGLYRNTLGNNSLNIGIRLDVEPNWENDPRLIVLRARKEGLIVATFSAEVASRRLHYATLSCSCGNPTATVDVENTERWQTVEASQLLDRMGSRIAIESNARVYIDTSRDENAQLMCASLLECKLGISLGCISCAHRNGMKKGINVIID